MRLFTDTIEFGFEFFYFLSLSAQYPGLRHITGGPPYPRVIRSKIYRGYVKPWIIRNTIYNVIQCDIPVTSINTVKFN